MEPELFFYSTDGTDSYGPVTEDALRRLIRDKVLNATSFVCREGESEWKPIDLPALLQPSTATRLPAYEPPPYVPTRKAQQRFVQEAEKLEAVWDDGPYPEALKWGCVFGAVGSAITLSLVQDPSRSIAAGLTAGLFFTALLPFLISRPFPRAWRLRVCAAAILVLATLTIAGQVRQQRSRRLEKSIQTIEADAKESARKEIATKGYLSGDLPQVQSALQKISSQTAQDDSAEARMVRASVGVTQALLQKIQVANDAEAACGNFDPATFGSLIDLNKLKESIAALRAAQVGVLTFLTNYDDHCRSALATGGFGAIAIEQFVAGAHQSGHIDAVMGVWKIKIKLADDHVARLDFLDKHWGSWQAREGKLYFATKDDIDTYNALTKALVDDVQQGRDLQKMTVQ